MLFRSIGGLVGRAEAWGPFEADWQEVINDFRPHGLSAFHAAACEVGEEDFANISRPIREAISQRFARVIAKHTDLRPFWSAVVNADWLAGTDDEFRERYERPFGLCWEWCVQQVAGWSKNYAESEPVSVFWSEQNDEAERMAEVFGYYQRHKRFSPLKSLKFASYRDVLPLQGADLLATEIMRSWRNKCWDQLMDRPEIKALLNGRGLHLGGCYDRAALETATRQFRAEINAAAAAEKKAIADKAAKELAAAKEKELADLRARDRKSTRLNSSH